MSWEMISAFVGVLSPLVGVPLVAITFYLRAIREHQTTAMAEVTHRMDAMEASIRSLSGATAEFEREYATKEEWVRESMLARQRLERLTEMVARIQAELETGQGLAAEMSRATAALVEMVREFARDRVAEDRVSADDEKASGSF
jgi:DNA-binding transcriptional regulator YbjK